MAVKHPAGPDPFDHAPTPSLVLIGAHQRPDRPRDQLISAPRRKILPQLVSQERDTKRCVVRHDDVSRAIRNDPLGVQDEKIRRCG